MKSFSDTFMCYAVPARVISIKGEHAEVDYGGVRRKVNVSLLPDAKEGNYILIHAGFAIEKVDTKKGKEALRLLADN